MAAGALTDRYAVNLHGVLSCYDRIIVTGTLPGACYAAGMTSFLYSRGIRIFDYPRFAEPLRERIRERAQQVCEAAGVQIEHVNTSHIRKEDLVARVLATRGEAPGLVHVISAMEACPSYKPWLDKTNGHIYLRPDTGSACITTSTSSMKSSACVTCACRPGRLSGCSSTATVTARWRAR